MVNCIIGYLDATRYLGFFRQIKTYPLLESSAWRGLTPLRGGNVWAINTYI